MANYVITQFVNNKLKRLVSNESTVDFASIKIGASAMELKETSGAFDFSAKKLSNIADGAANTDAVSKLQMETYVAAQALTGGKVKEAILDAAQLSNTQGVLAAEILYFAANLVDGDFVTIYDGTNTETYTAAAADPGAGEFLIGATAADTMSNLATLINGSSAYWGAVWSPSTLENWNSGNGVIVIYEKSSASGASTSRIYGTLATQTDGYVVAFNGLTEYVKTTAATQLPSSDPAAGRFGFRRQVSALVAGEIHLAFAQDSLRLWDDDAASWVTLSADAIPYATAASGGGIKGKASYDSDKGLEVNSGVVAIKIDNSTIGFNATTKVLEVKDAGITAAKIATAALGNGLTGGAGTAVAVSPDVTGGANLAKAISVTANGVAVKVDDSTIEGDATTGQLKVKAGGVTETQLNASVAGAGLTGGGGSALAVGAGDAIAVAADSVAVDFTVAKTNDNAGTITIRQVVYVKSNGNVDLAQANVAALPNAELGIVADATILTTASGKITFRRGAIIGGYSGLTPGLEQYVSRDTAGALVEALTGFVAGEHVYCVGRAISATEILFDPRYIIEY